MKNFITKLNINGSIFNIEYNNEKEIIIRINDCALGAFEDEIEKGRSTNSMINEYFDKYLSEYRLALLKVKTLKPFL